jgi:hypothetical protein
MSRIRLYFDEDAMQQALVVALRARRVEVLTASESGMIHRSDEHMPLAQGLSCTASTSRSTPYSTNGG